jgi:hypothetical protein
MDIIIDIMKSKKEKLIEENNLLLEIKELENNQQVDAFKKRTVV